MDSNNNDPAAVYFLVVLYQCTKETFRTVDSVHDGPCSTNCIFLSFDKTGGMINQITFILNGVLKLLV
jgi:hypothetical protein